MNAFWENIKTYLISAGWKILIAAVALVVGIILIKLVFFLLSKLFKRTHMDGAAANLIKQIIKAVLWVCLVLLILSILGFPITGLVAFISAGTVALGIALQNSLSNLASGMIIAASKPFKEGQYVEIDGIAGTVKSINFFNTELTSFDNKKIIVPNNKITGNAIINFSDQQFRMLSFELAFDYGADPLVIERVILGAIAPIEDVEKVPEPIVKVSAIDGGVLTFNIRVWIKGSVFRATSWAVNEAVYQALQNEGISPAYNKLGIQIENNPQ